MRGMSERIKSSFPGTSIKDAFHASTLLSSRGMAIGASMTAVLVVGDNSTPDGYIGDTLLDAFDYPAPRNGVITDYVYDWYEPNTPATPPSSDLISFSDINSISLHIFLSGGGKVKLEGIDTHLLWASQSALFSFPDFVSGTGGSFVDEWNPRVVSVAYKSAYCWRYKIRLYGPISGTLCQYEKADWSLLDDGIHHNAAWEGPIDYFLRDVTPSSYSSEVVDKGSYLELTTTNLPDQLGTTVYGRPSICQFWPGYAPSDFSWY